MAELEKLMEPVAEDSVAGPDLSYDPQRQEIESAFEAASLADVGEGEAPDWRAVIRAIEEQSARTKDAWLAVYLARAGARAQRLETVETGCAFLAAMYETYWDEMHPSLEEYGFQGRKGPCESLVRIGEFLGPLRRVTLVEHPRLGRFTCEDIEGFAEGEAAEGYPRFRAALADIPQEEIEASLERLNAIRASVERIDTVLTARADGDTGTNFSPLYGVLDSVRRSFSSVAGLEEPQDLGGAEEESAGDAAASGDGALSARRDGRIESRDDVMKALDAIIDYYRRREPGSAVPVVLGRVKGWVNQDFLAVLRDIAPGSIDDARRVLTATPHEE